MIANVGIIGNDSASNPVVELANASHCANEDSVDEGAQTEALDAARGYELLVYNGNGATRDQSTTLDAVPTILTGFLFCGKSFTSMFVLGRIGELGTAGGFLSNAITNINGFSVIYGLSMGMDGIIAQAYGAILHKQPKRCHLNSIIALERSMPRIPVGADDGSKMQLYHQHENERMAGRANGVARQADVVIPNRPGFDGEVGGSGPCQPTSVVGQASGVNAVGHQTDMVVPFIWPMVSVTNQNPMDLTIEEAKKFMRTR
ncbi:protein DETOXIFICATION 49 [Artemisia annua]|uniref:Protein DETOXIFICATION 49 n=1 Tax=Artemisia annua TaxID=35608 RepID=A0A2U1Q9N5_ARTAN|nr:protein DETOXIFICATION 49 [Artemisia annua]